MCVCLCVCVCARARVFVTICPFLVIRARAKETPSSTDSTSISAAFRALLAVNRLEALGGNRPAQHRRRFLPRCGRPPSMTTFQQAASSTASSSPFLSTLLGDTSLFWQAQASVSGSDPKGPPLWPARSGSQPIPRPCSLERKRLRVRCSCRFCLKNRPGNRLG
jgi:hypothetical protein